MKTGAKITGRGAQPERFFPLRAEKNCLRNENIVCESRTRVERENVFVSQTLCAARERFVVCGSRTLYPARGRSPVP